MRTLLVAALFATTFTTTASFVAVEDADARGRNERIAVCDWYRTKAQAHARYGNFERSEYYWHLFRACMDHRID